MADDEDLLNVLGVLEEEETAESPPRAAAAAVRRPRSVLNGDGRPPPQTYLQGSFGLLNPTHKQIAAKLFGYFQKKIHVYGNKVMTAKYAAVSEAYQSIKNLEGEGLPEEFVEFTDLRNCINYIAVGLFGMAKNYGIVFYSDDMDQLIMELAGKSD